MGPPKKPITRFGVTGVHTDSAATCDIIIVHGLNGDPERTWTHQPEKLSRRRGSSSASGGGSSESVFWPTDLLPTSLEHRHANILVYGYNADVVSRNEQSTSADFLFQHAQTLVQHVTRFRKSGKTLRNPIIWVAHSLGGLLVKRALLYSNDVRDQKLEDLRSIYVSTYGIIFLGTPHTGSGLATWGRVLQGMADAAIPRGLFDSEPILIKTLRKDNERLQEINNHFLDIFQRFQIMMAHETHKTNLRATKALIVDADSASPQLPGVGYYAIEATHSGMCKFENEASPGYNMTALTIVEWVDLAAPVIETRWNVEMEDRQARTRHEMEERTRQLMLSQTSQGQASQPMSRSPVPSPFEQSGGHAGAAGQSHLIEGTSSRGQQPMFEYTAEEVEEDQGAAEPVRHIIPTNNENAVIVAQPLPQQQPQAQGPSQTEPLPDVTPTSPMPLVPIDARPDLARSKPAEGPTAAVNDGPPFFTPVPFRPNSLFIGRDDEIEDLLKMALDKKRRAVGTAAVLIHAPPGGGKTHLAREFVYKYRDRYPGGIYWIRAKSIYEMEQFFTRIAAKNNLITILDSPNVDVVDAVREWFRTHDSWLIVFDGIHFDKDGVRRFIPDKENTSMIFTSTDSTAAGQFEFNNPQLLELGKLKAQYAQDLLLMEMGKPERSWTQDDRSRALELVDLMDRLPLMIHVAAQHLKATQEPLSKYLRSYKHRPKVGSLPAYTAVWDQLGNRGAWPALNLISILVFFDQHVPVGLLNLGLSALDERTPVLTNDSSHHNKTLNNSLKILIAFALLERTEGESVSPTSSRSSRSFERAAESLDILRIHSVVQQWVVEKLSDDKAQHHFWLGRAAAVFIRAYDEATRKIMEEHAKIGLQDDFKRFGVHAEKLLDHLKRYEKKELYIAEYKAQIEERLRQIPAKGEELRQARIALKATGSLIADGWPTSIFERACSLSETDSATPSSQRSLTATSDRFQGVASEDAQQFQSPIDVDTLHWHSDMPYRPYPDDDDEQTEIATPRMPALLPQGYPQGQSQSVVGSPPPDRLSSQDDWKEVKGKKHRVNKRQESRRYHDRAGAWRDQKVRDPRISISHENVQGSISKPGNPDQRPTTASTGMSGSQQMTGASGAEARLNNIRKNAPVTSRITGFFQEKGRSSSGTSVRPTSWAGVVAGKSSADAPGTFGDDNVETAKSPTTGGWIQRIKENIPFTRRRRSSAASRASSNPVVMPPRPSDPRWGPAPDQIPETAVESPANSSPRESHGDLGNSLSEMPPQPQFGGSRTARSSPGHLTGPFYPPGLPVEYNTGTGSGARYQYGYPAAMRQWGTEVYTPGRGRLDATDLAMASSDPLGVITGLPYPSNPTETQQQFNLNVYPPTGHPDSRFYPRQTIDGYTSEPMSRGPSGGQDSNGTGSGSGPAGRPALAPHGAAPQSVPLPRGVPFPSYPGQTYGYGHGGGRRSSFVETEPSPVIREGFDAVETS